MYSLKKKSILLVVLAMVFVCIPVIEYVAVNAENSYSYGDINGDGDINTKDIVRLMKYIAEDGEGIEAYSTDLNGDDRTDARDLVRLMKYIADKAVDSDDSDSSGSSSGDSVTAVTDTEVSVDETEPGGNIEDSTGEMQKQVFEIVNRERNANGLSSLRYATEAQAAADTRAKEIVTLFEHSRPDGRSCFTALEEIGISFMAAGENIAKGQPSAESVMNSWMNSAGHRENILNSNYSAIAVGCYKSGGTYYWVQLFIG